MTDPNLPEVGGKEVDRWLATDEWRLAVRLHDALCRRGHQMDQCWGLHLPYDLNQPRLSSIQREYLSRAQELIRLAGGVVEAERVMFAVAPNWPTPERIDPPESDEEGTR
jgi:hypothetical protein